MATITNTRTRIDTYEDEMLAMPSEEESARSADKKEGFIAWVNRVGKRNWMIIGAVVLIGAAVGLNWHHFAGNSTGDGYASYDQAAGMMGTGEQQAGAQGESQDDYFATVELNRQRARDESLEVLQNVLDSEAADETVKAQAMEEMSAIAAEIDAEANIEALLVSKGFDRCVAILNGSSINVVVSSEGELQPAQIAQINAVVYEQTGIEPIGVVISHRQ